MDIDINAVPDDVKINVARQALILLTAGGFRIKQDGLNFQIVGLIQTCQACGYQGEGWLDEGETCPKCKLVN